MDIDIAPSQIQTKRIGILLVGFDKGNLPALRFLLLHMNTLQNFIEYELLPTDLESEIFKMLSTKKPVDREKVRAQAIPFIKEYEAFLSSENAANNIKDRTTPDRFIIVTMAQFSDNFYTMRWNRLSVVSLGLWKQNMAPPSIIEFILTLVMREAVATLSKSLRGSTHYGTKGCLLDYTPMLEDTRYKVLNAFICSNCRSVLIHDGLPNLADEIVGVLDKKWFGNAADPNSPAGIAAKLGYHLFVTTGLEASAWEKITYVLKEEGIKQIISILGAVVIAGLLLWLGLK
jgi:hypothetical protein